jgi:hypothetical protein
MARDDAWRGWAHGQSSRPPWAQRTTVRGAESPRSRTGPQRTAQGRSYAGARHAQPPPLPPARALALQRDDDSIPSAQFRNCKTQKKSTNSKIPKTKVVEDL